MSDDTPKYEIFTTPVGELVYPWLSRADTRYEPAGMFQTKLLLPFEATATQELIAQLEVALRGFIETLDLKIQNTYEPTSVYEQETTDEGIATDNVLFKFKLKHNVTPAGKEAFVQTPVLVMADDGSQVGAPIYGGTMARLKGQIVPYTNGKDKAVGLTLRFRSVQVHELVTGSSEAGAFWSDFA